MYIRKEAVSFFQCLRSPETRQLFSAVSISIASLYLSYRKKTTETSSLRISPFPGWCEKESKEIINGNIDSAHKVQINQKI